MAGGRTRGSAALLVLFFALWVRGLTRSLRVGVKLVSLLRLCFGPRLRSRESACLSALVSCTFARTLLSMATADCSGCVARALTEGKWRDFAKHTATFAALGLPSSAVHAGLKYFTRMQALLFQRRLSHACNSKYIRGSNFFKASNLPQCKIDNVDQRVTTDVEKFADSASALLTTIFKPLLDVVLLTARLGRQLGVHAPAIVIGSSLLLSQLKLQLLPDVKRLAQLESELAGLYRNAHARLIAHAEEVALFHGGRRERALLDALLERLFRASVALSRHQLLLGVIDHYLIKSVSPCVAWALQARRHSQLGDRPLGEIVSGFVRTGAQLADLGSAVGHLVQASTKVASLAGITTRVSEVLEAVHRLEKAGNEPFLRRLPPRRVSTDVDEGCEPAHEGGALRSPRCEAAAAGKSEGGVASSPRGGAGAWPEPGGGQAVAEVDERRGLGEHAGRHGTLREPQAPPRRSPSPLSRPQHGGGHSATDGSRAPEHGSAAAPPPQAGDGGAAGAMRPRHPLSLSFLAEWRRASHLAEESLRRESAAAAAAARAGAGGSGLGSAGDGSGGGGGSRSTGDHDLNGDPYDSDGGEHDGDPAMCDHTIMGDSQAAIVLEGGSGEVGRNAAAAAATLLGACPRPSSSDLLESLQLAVAHDGANADGVLDAHGRPGQLMPRPPRAGQTNHPLMASVVSVVSSVEGGQMRRVTSSQRITAWEGDGSRAALELGGMVRFEKVAIASPDGQVLVRDLSFCVPAGRNVLITGPNGSGKSGCAHRPCRALHPPAWPCEAGCALRSAPAQHRRCESALCCHNGAVDPWLTCLPMRL